MQPPSPQHHGHSLIYFHPPRCSDQSGTLRLAWHLAFCYTLPYQPCLGEMFPVSQVCTVVKFALFTLQA